MNERFEALERNARNAKHANSFRDYREGSATSEYKAYCAKADEIAEQAKARLASADAPPKRAQGVDWLLARYKEKKLEWLSKLYAVRASIPSVMICGPANFPTREKEKQLAREKALYAEDPEYLLEKIREVGRNAKTIYSDDENAVERIKEKIERLKNTPDPYGNKKAEIRRLKERLLALAPEEFAEQQANITVNGAKTYAEIVALWDTGKVTQYGDRWHYELVPLVFTDGKRKYKEFVSIEIDEAGENLLRFNLDTRETDAIPLTNELKYAVIIGRISGSGNKAVIYQHLRSLLAAVQEPKAAEAEQDGKTVTVTVNGEEAEVVRDREGMRLRLIFAGKPEEATRTILKSNGFKWAPSAGAWQRLLNGNAESALRWIADKDAGNG